MPDSEPTICQHCKQYNGDCTFYLPIQETRFKKQRMQEAAAAGSSSGGQTIDFKPPLPSANIKHDPSLSLPPLNRASSSSASEPKEVKIYGVSWVSCSKPPRLIAGARLLLRPHIIKLHSPFDAFCACQGFRELRPEVSPNLGSGTHRRWVYPSLRQFPSGEFGGLAQNRRPESVGPGGPRFPHQLVLSRSGTSIPYPQ